MKQNHSPKQQKKLPVNGWVVGAILAAVIMAVGAVGFVTMGPFGEPKSQIPPKKVASRKITAKPVSTQTSKHETPPTTGEIPVNINTADSVSKKPAGAVERPSFGQFAGGGGDKPSPPPANSNNGFSTMTASIDDGPDQDSSATSMDKGQSAAASDPKASLRNPFSQEPAELKPDDQKSVREASTSQISQSPEAGSRQPELLASAARKPAAQASLSQEAATQSPLTNISDMPDREDPATKAMPPTADSGLEQSAPFTVQVGVFRNRFYAGRQENLLRERNYPSFIHEIIGKDQQPLYLVCFGRFTTRKETLAAVNEFKVKEEMDAVAAFLDSP